MPDFTSQEEAKPWVGKLFLSLIGVMLLGAGGVFTWLMARSYQNAQATRSWIKTPAVVVTSETLQRELSGSPREFALELIYEYQFQGETHRSNKLSIRGRKWTKVEENVEKLSAHYAVGSNQMAWVNPDKPEVAVLEHDSKAAGYSIWFPLLISVGGIGMIVGAWRGNSKHP